MTATRYTAQGKRAAAARRAAAHADRRRAIAATTLDEFLVDFCGYSDAARVPADLREAYAVEWDGARAEYPEAVPA